MKWTKSGFKPRTIDFTRCQGFNRHPSNDGIIVSMALGGHLSDF